MQIGIIFISDERCDWGLIFSQGSCAHLFSARRLWTREAIRKMQDHRQWIGQKFIFDATWLDTSAELGNSTTYALVESLATRLAGPKRNLLARKLPTQSPLANL